MSFSRQNEAEARTKIKDLCDGYLPGYILDVKERKPNDLVKYTALFAVSVKDGGFTPEFIAEVFTFCQDDTCLFTFAGTFRDTSDLSFEVLYIGAEVTP